MLIECPYCHARAKLPDSKEGAKVRCGECNRVYVAREPGRRGAGASKSNTGLLIGIGVAIVAAVLLLVVTSTDSNPTPVAVDKPDVARSAPAAVDLVGWDSEALKTVRAIHEAAYGYDEGRIRANLHPAKLWEKVRADAPEDSPLHHATSFSAVSREERDDLLDGAVEELVRGEARELVGEWRPYDGSVIEEADGVATVRVAVTSRDEARAGEARSVDWKLALDGDRWKAFAWERYIAPGEIKTKHRGPRGVEKVTLSDGSVVYERQPEPLAHLEDTPPDVRKRIDAAYATMIDLNLTREAGAAKRDLVAIGKPAIPKLLTGLFEIPLETEDQAKQVNQIVQALREITGNNFGFEPMLLVGSAVGTTEERRTSAIRQWFAWWYKYADRFEEKEEVDALDGLLEPKNEKERRFLEREEAKEQP